MLITIKYFGQIAEVTSKEEESLEFSGDTISDLLNALHSKYDSLKNKDFHITLGFNPDDIYGVTKNSSTLIKE